MRYARNARTLVLALLVTALTPGLSAGSSVGAGGKAPAVEQFTLAQAVEYAVIHNPVLLKAAKEIDIQTYGIDAAKAERMPRLDFTSGVLAQRYYSPLFLKFGGSETMDLYNRFFDAGVSLKLPVYRGGRLVRGVAIAEMRRDAAAENFRLNRQELEFNVTSVFYKISQLEKLLIASDATVVQRQQHRDDAALFLEAGAGAKIDLLKAEVELAHTREISLQVKNSIEGAYELLKSLMGIDDQNRTIAILPEPAAKGTVSYNESIQVALEKRPDYRAAVKRRQIAGEIVKLNEGRNLPEVSLAGEFSERAGDGKNELHESNGFKENWNAGIRLTVPLFDGGLIRADINRSSGEAAKAAEEERAVRLTVIREVRDAHNAIENARKRVDVTEKAIDAARESLRIESLRYKAGAGRSTDVTDAQTALLRAESDFYHASFDLELAFAALRKATGEDGYVREAGK